MTKGKAKIKIATGTSIIFALSVSACGGGGGGVNSIPPAPFIDPSPPPPPPPPPPPGTSFDTTEYRSSNGAVQAQAISAYNAGVTGRGVIAGVMDSGLDLNSAEFSGRIHPSSGDFAGNRGLQDEDGHGTSVSAVMLGARNDLNMHGIAFDATLLVLRTDAPGSCADTSADGGCAHDDNDMARALDRAVAVGARVVNMSLGGDTEANATLRAAFDRATAAGVVIVVSAGNEFEERPATAINPEQFAMIATDAIARGQIIIAGATDANRQITTFSNRAGTGSNVYLTALGEGVRAPGHDGRMQLWNGTSFSAPIISGAVALLAQAFPNLTGQQIVDLLLRTADDLGGAGTDSIYGRGELNIARAFAPRGSTSLASTKVAVPLAGATGTLSSPMGDATSSNGPKAVILDVYGRAYNIDFSGSLDAAKAAPTLEPALANDTETRLATSNSMAIALSVAKRGHSVGIDRLDLNEAERRKVRAIAGSVVAKLGQDKKVAIGFSRSSGALIDQMTIERAAAFVAADDTNNEFGFFMRPTTAFSYRQSIGRFGLSLGSEIGNARVWTDRAGDPLRTGYRGYSYVLSQVELDRRFGPASFGLNGTFLDEKSTILGASNNIWTGVTGAKSYFAAAKAKIELDSRWQLGASYRHGWTRIGAAGLRQNTDWLQTNAWSADVTRFGVFSLKDQLAIRFSRPLRVVKGGVNLNLPTSYDYATLFAGFENQFVSLKPNGREQTLELSYATPLWGGNLGTNLYWRQQPGNLAYAPDDIGLALRFRSAF